MKSTTKSLRVDPAYIKQTALDVFGLTQQQMESSTRDWECVDCRRVIAYLMSKHTNLSCAKIGKHIGNRHRSTVEHNIGSFEGLHQTDKKFAAKVALIKQKLEVSHES